MRNSILSIGICLIMILAASPIHAQGAIDSLYSKNKEMEGLHKFNLSEQQLNQAKIMSYNLNQEQKDLLLRSEEQYTILYKGEFAKLNEFYAESINFLNTNRYEKVSDLAEPETVGATYAFIDQGKVKELVVIIRNQIAISILVSKGEFGKKPYAKAEEPDPVK